MTVTTEDGGRQNMFAKEPQMYTMEVAVTHNEKAEQLNGRLAMLGVIAAIGAYAISGQLIPGIWWSICELGPWVLLWPYYYVYLQSLVNYNYKYCVDDG